MTHHLKIGRLNVGVKAKNHFQPFINCLHLHLCSHLNNPKDLHGEPSNITSMNNRTMAKPKYISDMRKPYRNKQDIFDLDQLVSKEPFGQFEAWFNEAKHTDGIIEANAMNLATASKDGKPSSRMVLMKGIDKDGIVFFTNFLSHKAKDLSENPFCSVLFYWEPLKRQIRVEGAVEKVSDEEATSYFHSRPRDSQIGACVSQQSQIVASRQIIDDRNKELQEKYNDLSVEIPKPDYWGGYRVRPNRFEFWQGQTNRLHDRIVFRRLKNGELLNKDVTHEGEDGWVYERLMP